MQDVVIPWHTWVELLHATGGAVAVYLPDATNSTLLKVRRADTARVLAECEAKRRIVAYADTMTQLDRDRSRTRSGDAWVMLTSLALPYAGHESYREEWKP